MALLQCHELEKSFGGTKAIAGICLAARAGEIVSIIGPNGAGKTTLFNVITGFLQPDRGHVVYADREITGLPPHTIARRGIGRTFQDLRTIGQLTALETVWLAMPGQKGETVLTALAGLDKRERLARVSAARKLLDYVGIVDQATSPVAEMSYGQQKLLTIATCLALDAPLLLLDEPVAGVNPAMIDQIVHLLQRLRDEAGKTILLIEHDMNAVMSISDRVIAMDEGRIIADGSPAVVRESAALIEAFL